MAVSSNEKNAHATALAIEVSKLDGHRISIFLYDWCTRVRARADASQSEDEKHVLMEIFNRLETMHSELFFAERGLKHIK